MYKEDKFVLNQPKASSKENLYLEGYGKRWGEKLTFTVGLSYICAGVAGMVAGPILSLRATKQRRYGSQGLLTKTAARWANYSACATLLFCVTGKVLDLAMEEEIKDFGQMTRNVTAGALTGAMYKGTLGLRPAIVGSIIGAGSIVLITSGINFLNDQNIIGFRVDV
jgi:import inner membrane translocase subunit TIM23